jgi:hypothetical protein
MRPNRLLVSVGLVLALAATWPRSAGAADRGDLNNDGVVTISDAALAIKMVVGLANAGPDALAVADVAPPPNGDGKVGLDDVIRILRFALGLIPPSDFYQNTSGQMGTFTTSLHGSGSGKIAWYSAANGGFETISQIPYNQLSCQNCHKPKCDNCHDTSYPKPGATVAQSKCEGCHSRQMAEAASYSDVHRDAGMKCMSCHTKREMHGDGTTYQSMLQQGAMDVSCESCHPNPPSSVSHTVHGGKVACASCHSQSVVSCYNCHFDAEVKQGQKIPYGQFKNWLLLVSRNGKVYPANFQSVEYHGKTFIAMAPFFSHTVQKQGRQCDDCHNSPAVQQYKQSGKIDVVKWNDATGKLEPITGVVPVIPNYQTDMRFDFAEMAADGSWHFLKTGVDQFQLRWGEPLTADQMSKLAR